MSITSTPYDDVYRTLLNDCSSLILPVINEMFGEHYTGEEQIVFGVNEHFLNQQDGEEEKRITDTAFNVYGAQRKKYHLECESTPDNTMLIRMFEYDSQLALDEGEISGSTLTVTFPHSGILYLRHNQNTPDQMTIRLKTPDGEISYNVKTLKAQVYTIEEIFGKKLLFLIPFHIFSHESRFSVYNDDTDKLAELKEEYEMIKRRLEELMLAGEIDEFTKCTIIDMSNKVLEHIALSYENVRKGVKDTMGGRVLDYEAKDILNNGISKGKREVAEKMIRRGELSFDDIADYAGITVQEVEKIAEEMGVLVPA